MPLQIKLLILVPFSITGVSHKAVQKFKTSVGNHEESEDEQCSFEQRSSRSDSFRKQRVVRGTLSKSFETFLNTKIRQVQALDEILFYIMSCEFPLCFLPVANTGNNIDFLNRFFNVRFYSIVYKSKRERSWQCNLLNITIYIKALFSICI